MKKLFAYAKRNTGATIAMVIVILVCALLVWKNIGSTAFFSANAVEIITILLGMIIAFYLSERMNDKRRRNDCIEHIIVEIEDFVANDENYKNCQNSLMKQSSCANRIKYIKDAAFSDIKDDVGFIEQHFAEIRDLFSNHYQNEDELKSVKKDIDKHRDLIADKCCKIRIGLYSGSIYSK